MMSTGETVTVQEYERLKAEKERLQKIADAALIFSGRVAHWCKDQSEKIAWDTAMAFGLEANQLADALEEVFKVES